MVVESVRLKLHRTLKGRFDKEFKAGLEEPADAGRRGGPCGLDALPDLGGRGIPRAKDARQKGAGVRREGVRSSTLPSRKWRLSARRWSI